MTQIAKETQISAEELPAKPPFMRVMPIHAFSNRNLAKLRTFKDIVHVRLGFYDFYLITNPSIIQEVLVTKQRDFIKGRFLQRAKKVFGEGLLTSEGSFFHHRERKLVLPAFHHDHIETYARTMVSYADEICAEWRDREVLDIHSEMERMTMRIVAKCLFNADIESESQTLARDLALMIDYFSRLSRPFARILERLPSNKKYIFALERIDNMMYELINRRRQSHKDEGDLLSILLSAKDELGAGMSDSQVRDEVLILFAAGHETIADALTWTWYLLSQNPSVEEKMHAEVFSILGSAFTASDASSSSYPCVKLPSARDFHKLEYTTKVFTESMRLFPPVWVLVRLALVDSTIGDYFIPEGAGVVMSQYVTHRDPRFFDHPDDFDPDRWTPQMKEGLPKFAYFPFGGGPTGCVGEQFAWMEGVLLLATIARKWKMNHVKNHKVETLGRITLRPKYGMKMQVLAR